MRLADVHVGKIESRNGHESLLVEKRLASQMDVSGGSTCHFLFVIVFIVVHTTVNE
jgi:hypothetical protein